MLGTRWHVTDEQENLLGCEGDVVELGVPRNRRHFARRSHSAAVSCGGNSTSNSSGGPTSVNGPKGTGSISSQPWSSVRASTMP